MLLSVIIPFYNNALLAEGCLRSLCSVPMAAQAEVILVDDGSSLSEFELLQDSALRMLTSWGMPYRLLQQPHRGAAAARNLGLTVAQGRFLWFVDADDTLFAAHLSPLLEVLQSLPDGADLLHTGPMLTVMQPSQPVVAPTPDVEATQPVSLPDLMQPHSPALDHTTYIVSRSLVEQGGLRYPEGHVLLEDSCFVLSLLDRAQQCYSNATLQPYMHHVYLPSTTAGAWPARRCKTFVADICYFFEQLHLFNQRHPDADPSGAFFGRYRYVYLRVLAVKGCPWPLLASFRQQVLPLPPGPRGLKERLLHFAPTHWLIASLCRLFRKRK